MNLTLPGAARALLGSLTLLSLTGAGVQAQNCDLPDFPNATITSTQDRDRMLCRLGITLPALPPRLEDPNRPPNAFPRVATNPEGNWTDPLGHTVVRTAFGQWHTYDSFPYGTDEATRMTGGAMAPFADYGPGSEPRYTDIELLRLSDATPVASPEDWWIKRRPEIAKAVRDELYGHIPDRSLWPGLTWSEGPVTTGTANGVAYKERLITGTIDISSYPEVRNVPRILCTLRTPLDKEGQKVPVFIAFGGVGGLWAQAGPRGYGVCGFNQGQLQPDSGGANLSSWIIGLINKGHWRKPEDWGALAAWSWGISRLIDFFEAYPETDGTKIAVHGHSRFGKATLVAAAFDDRVTSALPGSAGALGTSWARRAYGETLEFVASATGEYHWVAGNIMKYCGELNPGTFWPRKVENLTVDAHSLIALIAPRAVMTNGGTDTPRGNGEAWQDPRGMYLSAAIGAQVWEHLGWKGLIVPDGTVFTSGVDESWGGTPPFDVAFIEGTVGYRRHPQGHTSTPTLPSWVEMTSRYFNDNRPVVAAQSFVLGAAPVGSVGTLQATDADDEPVANWQVKGGTGAYKFAVDPATGTVRIADASAIDFTAARYELVVTADDGKLAAADAVVAIELPRKMNVCHRNGKTLNITTADVPDHLGHGDAIGVCAD
jgi:hypothetical protein